MKRRVCVIVLIGCLGPIDLYASELSDQTPELNDQAPDLNRPPDLHNQPNEWSGRIAAGLIETDNVERTATDPMSDTIEEVSADVALHEQTRRLDADVLSNLQYLNFAHDIYPHEVVGNFIGSSTFAVLPKEFEWVALDNFGQQQLDPTTAVTPINLENINYFSTGPDLLIALSPLVHAQVSARFSNVYYQTSDLNNNRGDASVALVRSLSATSNVSLNVAAGRILYDDSAANPDYTTQEAYLRYDAQGARSKLAVDLGYDEVTGLSSTGAGPLVHVDATRVLSPASRLDLSFGQDISDTSNLLRQLQGLNGLAVNATYLQRADDPFINRYARAAWDFDRNRTFVNFDVAVYQERHLEDSSLNQVRTQSDVSVRRNLAPALTASVGASYARGTFTASAASYRNLSASAGLDWRIGRHLDVRTEYDRFDQRGDVMTNQYTENRIGVTVGWQVDSTRLPGTIERNGNAFPGL
jgi:hypothetical protein